MTPKDLEAIQKRWEASTPGKWWWQYNGLQTEILSTESGVKTVAYWDDRGRANEPSAADLEFIAHAHQDVPVLLNYIEHLLTRIEELREDCGHNQK